MPTNVGCETAKQPHLDVPTNAGSETVIQPCPPVPKIDETLDHSKTVSLQFRCPCNKCDLATYLGKKCPKSNSSSYPYLSLDGLSDAKKKYLIQKLNEDTASMHLQFAELLASTRESIKKRNISVIDLVCTAEGIGVYKSVNNPLPLSQKAQEGLGIAESTDHVFRILQKHMSFFNHEILKHIITVRGNEDDKEMLKTFDEHFKEFCKRKVFEVSPNAYSSEQEENENQLFVVLATEDLIISVGDAENIKTRIASILGLNTAIVELKRIDCGSIILVFSIPIVVSQQVFPLSPEVHKQLKSYGYNVIVPDMSDSVLHYENQIPFMKDILTGLVLLNNLSLGLVTNLQTILNMSSSPPQLSLIASLSLLIDSLLVSSDKFYDDFDEISSERLVKIYIYMLNEKSKPFNDSSCHQEYIVKLMLDYCAYTLSMNETYPIIHTTVHTDQSELNSESKLPTLHTLIRVEVDKHSEMHLQQLRHRGEPEKLKPLHLLHSCYKSEGYFHILLTKFNSEKSSERHAKTLRLGGRMREGRFPISWTVESNSRKAVMTDEGRSGRNTQMVKEDSTIKKDVQKHNYLTTATNLEVTNGQNLGEDAHINDDPRKEMFATEETQYGAKSVMQFSSSLSTLSIWKTVHRSECATKILLPQHDFCLKHHLIEQAHVQGQCNLSVLFEIISLLHSSDYVKILQLLENIENLDPGFRLHAAYFVKGVAYFNILRLLDAEWCFKRGIELALASSKYGDVMICYAYLGDIKYASENYLEAAELYMQACKYFISNPTAKSSDCAILFKLTLPTLSAIQAKRALAFAKSLKIVEAENSYKATISKTKSYRDLLLLHTSLGNLYQSMGDNNNAVEEYKQSIDLAEKLNYYVPFGWAHGNIGIAYLSLNKKDEALHHLQKSLDLAIEYEQTPQAIGHTYNNLGIAYLFMNDLDKAEEYYDLALSQAIYGNDIPGQARVYGNIGNVYVLRKNYERAIPHYSEVLHLSSDPSTVNTARHNRGYAYYDWATSLHRKMKPKKIHFHGPDCNVDSCLMDVPRNAKELYEKGRIDLEKVVKHHEERFQHIKGLSQGLSLSVSLFESNSRTFHRLQDCLVNLHKYEEALVVAEQSRARTLGELILKRKGGAVSLTPPLNFDQIMNILKRIDWPLIYFSYTGARLICWMFVSHSGQITWNTFEVPLADDQFDGKSFDYYLRYSLTEKLVERSFEMYQSIEYDISSSEEVQTLYELIGKPIVTFLQKHRGHSVAFEQVTVISDSYTSLLPLTCLLDSQTKSFLGDHYYFNMVPSFLTMGIMSECPCNRVEVQDSYNDLCIVGDPNIPPFYHSGNLWVLGRLPYAKREAEWVAHALKVTPILGDQATKSSLLIRLMNAKVVHIATHGSASEGFLAFAPFAVSAQSGTNKCVEGSNVLLYPQDVEKILLSPALVVLSRYDSGRGTVKADGIQGMARAFTLAGAQSVLTTLWKVPDESASVFMQFFYQYLVDGFKSSLALQKAILSVRCFVKYSQYIHWSGYQLIGRESQFSFKRTPLIDALQQKLGSTSIFPRLADIKKIEKALVNSPCPPTDIQVCIEFSLTIVTWKKI